MMERLTHYQKNGEVAEPYNRIQAHEFAKKLAQYEDLEEQGLLVRLPCKVGDTVYCNGDEYKIYYLVYCSKTTTETPAIKFFAECMYNANCDDIDFWDYEIGKNVFLTREEAEAALEKTEQSK